MNEKKELNELVFVPYYPDSDQIAAARALVLLNGAQNVKVTKNFICPSNIKWLITDNSWFFTSKNLDQVQSIKKIHIIGIGRNYRLSSVFNILSKQQCEVYLYTIPSRDNNIPEFPINVNLIQLPTFCYCSYFINNIIEKMITLSYNDALLFLIALYERTWCGLNSRITNIDKKCITYLQSYNLPQKLISNTICLGLREGQKGLLKDIILSASEQFINGFPITISVVRSSGNVQETKPILESAWAKLDPYALVIGLLDKYRTQIFCRSKFVNINFRKIFKFRKYFIEDGWIKFEIEEQDETKIIKALLKELEDNFRFEPMAKDIVSPLPKCVDSRETVANVHDIMLLYNLMCVVVTQNNKYLGVITRRDIDRAIQMNLWDAEIGTFVSQNIPSVEPETPIRVVKKLMITRNLYHIPVVKKDQVLGVINALEVLRSLSDNIPLPSNYLPIEFTSKLPSSYQIKQSLKKHLNQKIYNFLQIVSQNAKSLCKQVYLVGGFVRDLLLNRKSFDMDIVVIGDALEFVEKLKAELSLETHIFEEFHTVRVKIDDYKVDFATARIEHYSKPAALPHVEFSGLSSDLFRRDFTINALAISLNIDNMYELIDFFGGYNDLLDRKIKILHFLSFFEDPTRLFRAVRFMTRFNFDLEFDTQRAFNFALEKEVITNLSLSRISAEVTRCLLEENPYKVLKKLLELGLLRYIHDNLNKDNFIYHLNSYKIVPNLLNEFSKIFETQLDKESILWTGLLMHISQSDVKHLMNQFNFSYSRKQKILQSLNTINNIPLKLANININDKVSLFFALRNLYPETYISLMAFGLDSLGRRKVKYFLLHLKNTKCELSGSDLINLGIKPGPQIRAILDDLIAKKIKGEISSRKEEEEYVRKNANLCFQTQ